jgi:hypothetical protein
VVGDTDGMYGQSDRKGDTDGMKCSMGKCREGGLSGEALHVLGWTTVYCRYNK